jgi:hypothetical protein
MSDHTETRLDRLEISAVETHQRLGVVETQLKGIGADLKMVVQSVTHVQAQPRWELTRILDIATKGGALCVLVAGLITYIATNINAVANMRAQMQAEMLQARLDNGWFKPSTLSIRSPGGAVTQQ